MTSLKIRVTSLEKFGQRTNHQFSEEGLNFIKKAGYNGVLVNGGAGIGPDMLTPEMFIESEIIPDLMPQTIKTSKKEIARRFNLLKGKDLKPWICSWGIIGPNFSKNNYHDDYGFYDRRTKLEMRAKLVRTPELFGYRKETTINWRGTRPLCLSNETVCKYYNDIYTRMLQQYPEIEGVMYFGGDNNIESCDDSCPICRQSSKNSLLRYIEYINEAYKCMKKIKPDIKVFLVLFELDSWKLNNQTDPNLSMYEWFKEMSGNLFPEIGLCISFNDSLKKQRKNGEFTFNQPWMIATEAGEHFKMVKKVATEQGRTLIVMQEFSESEVFDPCGHNMPITVKTLQNLKALDFEESISGFFDFWGNRWPFTEHANHEVMKFYFSESHKDEYVIFNKAAINHYKLPENTELVQQVISLWEKFDECLDTWNIKSWSQRFSFAVGRNGARGALYLPLVPAMFSGIKNSWAYTSIVNASGCEEFYKNSLEDEKNFMMVGEEMIGLAAKFKEHGYEVGGKTLNREGWNICLVGSLIGSIGRTVRVISAYDDFDEKTLRTLIELEIEARQKQLEITGRIYPAGGINELLVQEDIANMQLYLSLDTFPYAETDMFEFTSDMMMVI